jgi:hypothetical protein
LLEREETRRFGGMKAGVIGLPAGLDPVQDCRRPRKIRDKPRFFNGLIHCLHRRVKTGFRFALPLAAPGLFGSNLDTPRHLVREGRLFNVVLPGVSDGLVS